MSTTAPPTSRRRAASSPYAPTSRNTVLRRRRRSSTSSPTSPSRPFLSTLFDIISTTLVGGKHGTYKQKLLITCVGIYILVKNVLRNEQSWKKEKKLKFGGEFVWEMICKFVRKMREIKDRVLSVEDQRNLLGFHGGTENEEEEHDDNISTLAASSSRSITTSSPSSNNLNINLLTTDLQQINTILSYWFTSYPTLEQCHKKLWMIPSSSHDHRCKVDLDIYTKFGSTLQQLIDKDKNGKLKRWCGGESDMEGELFYGYRGKLAAILVLDQFSRHILRHLSSDNCNTLNLTLPRSQDEIDVLAYQTSLSFTSSHLSSTTTNEGMTIPTPQIVFALMPYRHANTLANVQFVQEEIAKMGKMAGEVETLISRFRKATTRRMNVLQDEARRTGSSAASSSTSSGTVENKEKAKGETEAEKRTAVEETKEKKYTDEDILETFPFEPSDISNIHKHVVVKEIASFLATKLNIIPNATTTSEEGMSKRSNGAKAGEQREKRKWNKKKKTQPSLSTPTSKTTSLLTKTTMPPPNNNINNKKYPIIVSLSGGVDSMVILAILHYLNTTSPSHKNQMDINAIHIDYANRPESGAEANYVQSYCENRGIKFYKKRIEEVTRGVTQREEYESISRNVRYDMYKLVIQECLDRYYYNPENKEEKDTTKTQQILQVGIMLGHHKGDLRENVLSNAHRGCSPLDLSGMTSISIIDSVHVYRPLLHMEKEDIYSYAHTYGIPYFKDTTPSWSTRGKLRNQLLPLLQDVYGEGSMEHLSTLAVESDEAKELVRSIILQPFMNCVSKTCMGIILKDLCTWKEYGLFFWKLVLRDVLHGGGRGMFSDGGVLTLLERLQMARVVNVEEEEEVMADGTKKMVTKTIMVVKEGWLQSRKDYAVYLRKDGSLFVLHPESFPWRKSEQFTECVGKAVPYGTENSVTVGPWKVTSELISPDDVNESDAKVLLSKKAFDDMDEFMLGRITYYVRIPLISSSDLSEETEEGVIGMESTIAPRPLVFVSEYIRESRPLAWRNIDLKIQSTLPLLGTDKVASAFMPVRDKTRLYGKEWQLVCVRLVCEGATINTENDGTSDELKGLKDATKSNQDVNSIEEISKGEDLTENRDDNIESGSKSISDNQGHQEIDKRSPMNNKQRGTKEVEMKKNDEVTNAKDLKVNKKQSNSDDNGHQNTRTNGGANQHNIDADDQPRQMTPNELWDSLILPFVQGK